MAFAGFILNLLSLSLSLSRIVFDTYCSNSIHGDGGSGGGSVRYISSRRVYAATFLPGGHLEPVYLPHIYDHTSRVSLDQIFSESGPSASGWQVQNTTPSLDKRQRSTPPSPSPIGWVTGGSDLNIFPHPYSSSSSISPSSSSTSSSFSSSYTHKAGSALCISLYIVRHAWYLSDVSCVTPAFVRCLGRRPRDLRHRQPTPPKTASSTGSCDADVASLLEGGRAEEEEEKEVEVAVVVCPRERERERERDVYRSLPKTPATCNSFISTSPSRPLSSSRQPWKAPF